MKVTKSGRLKHIQLHHEDYLQRVSAEQKEYAEVCEPPKMTETDITNKIRTRFENLKRAGLEERKAWMWANTKQGYWRTAHSPILLIVLSNKRIKRAVYLSLMDCYLKEKCKLLEPPCTERYARWCGRSATQIMGGLLSDQSIKKKPPKRWLSYQ